MPDITRRSKSAVKYYYPSPFFLRAIDDDEKYSVNSQVLRDYQIVSLQKSSGQEGGDILTIKPFNPDKYAICSDENILYDQLMDKVIYLEQKISDTSTNKYNRNTLFFGKVTSIAYNYSDTENSMDITVKGPWSMLDSPVRMDTKGLLVGQVLGYIAANTVTKSVYNRTSQTYQTITTTFDPPLIPEDGDGNPLGKIDPDLLSIFYLGDGIELTGQPVSEAINDCIAVRKNLISDVDYNTNGTFTIVGREIGKRKHQLVIGRIGKEITRHKYIPDIQTISGSINYEAVVNQVVGRGAEEKTPIVEDLVKTWTEEQELEFLADDTLKDDLNYTHIGRLYRITSNCIPMNPKANKMSGGLSEDSTYNDSVQIYELNPETNVYQKGSNNPQFITTRIDGNTTAIPTSVNRFLNFENGRYAYVWFDEIQLAEWYSSEQRALQLEDESQTPNQQLKSLKIQAIKTGDKFEIFTGINGDRKRKVKFHETSYEKFNAAYVYKTLADRSLMDDAVAPVDESETLLKEIEDILSESYKPDYSINITIWYLETKFQIGDRIDKIIDTHGTVVFDNLDWIIVGITHDFINFRTELQLSKYVKYFNGAISI